LFFPYLVLCCLVLVATTGCTSGRLNAARENYYMGKPDASIENLQDVSRQDPNQVLQLMERGMAYQTLGRHKDATDDWIAAHGLANNLDYYSVSKGATSLMVNDRVLTYAGAPYERTLLHAFAAESYMAMGLWDDAAVEARNMVDRLESLEGFPDDAYSRYIAGFCFEMIRDFNGSAIEYRAASALTGALQIDPETGAMNMTASNSPPLTQRNLAGPELVCFIGIGRGPTEYGMWVQKTAWGPSPYAKLYAGNMYLGRSYIFTTTQKLMVDTQKKIAVLQAAKTVTRVAMKEVVAHQVSEKNMFLGELVRLLLFSMETTDTRRWETLPLWLQIARVPCPPDLKEFRIVFYGQNDAVVKEVTVTQPLTRRGNTFVSSVRAL